MTSKPRCEDCRRIATVKCTVTHSNPSLGIAVSLYCSDHAPSQEAIAKLAAVWSADITREEI